MKAKLLPNGNYLLIKRNGSKSFNVRAKDKYSSIISIGKKQIYLNPSDLGKKFQLMLIEIEDKKTEQELINRIPFIKNKCIQCGNEVNCLFHYINYLCQKCTELKNLRGKQNGITKL